ncbi:MAG: hypothetical protein JSS04_07885 [Proteobacteria bacterium]|nr:hypothetical protein [Pseudomonadota bacterium]
MTVLKLLATLMAAGLLTFLAAPGFAANGDDGVTSGPPSNSGDPTAKPRRHRKHPGHHRHHRRKSRDGKPSQVPVPQG